MAGAAMPGAGAPAAPLPGIGTPPMLPVMAMAKHKKAKGHSGKVKKTHKRNSAKGSRG